MKNENTVKVRHHYVPVLYLRSFTDTGHQGGRIYAKDLDTGKKWPSTPRALAFENDYNSVDGELRADAFEDALAEVESKTAASWHKMIATKSFPTNATEQNDILNLLALQETRTKPNRRATFNLQEAAYKKLHEVLTSTPEIFAGQIAIAKAAGVDIPELPPGITLEDVRKRSRDGSIIVTADIPTGFYIKRMFEHADLILKNFSCRTWKLFDFSKYGVEIVTSDDPVSLCWASKAPPIKSPGFGFLNTLVIVPASPETVLIGSFEEGHLSINPSRELALSLNEITVKHSFRFIFSRQDDVMFSNNGYANLSKSIEEEIKYRVANDRISTNRSFVYELGPMIVLTDERDPCYIDLSRV